MSTTSSSPKFFEVTSVERRPATDVLPGNWFHASVVIAESDQAAAELFARIAGPLPVIIGVRQLRLEVGVCEIACVAAQELTDLQFESWVAGRNWGR